MLLDEKDRPELIEVREEASRIEGPETDRSKRPIMAQVDMFDDSKIDNITNITVTPTVPLR